MVHSKKKEYNGNKKTKKSNRAKMQLQMGGHIDLETFEINPNAIIDYDSIKVAKHINAKWPKDDELWPGPPPTDCTIL